MSRNSGQTFWQMGYLKIAKKSLLICPVFDPNWGRVWSTAALQIKWGVSNVCHFWRCLMNLSIVFLPWINLIYVSPWAHFQICVAIYWSSSEFHCRGLWLFWGILFDYLLPEMENVKHFRLSCSFWALFEFNLILQKILRTNGKGGGQNYAPILISLSFNLLGCSV